jgi:putative AdoMet-dependent methyltransferase
MNETGIQMRELFDVWSGTYEDSALRHEAGYPFAGYADAVNYINESVIVEAGTAILELGVGTGLASYPLYKAGAEIYGIDFSEKMADLAKKKMPLGFFVCADIRNGIPSQFDGVAFDYCIASYTLHHLPPDDVYRLIDGIKKRMTGRGSIIIADIAFETRPDLEKCRNDAGARWDEGEWYLVAGECIPDMQQRGFSVHFHKASECAGVFELK